MSKKFEEFEGIPPEDTSNLSSKITLALMNDTDTDDVILVEDIKKFIKDCEDILNRNPDYTTSRKRDLQNRLNKIKERAGYELFGEEMTKKCKKCDDVATYDKEPESMQEVLQNRIDYTNDVQEEIKHLGGKYAMDEAFNNEKIKEATKDYAKAVDKEVHKRFTEKPQNHSPQDVPTGNTGKSHSEKIVSNFNSPEDISKGKELLHELLKEDTSTLSSARKEIPKKVLVLLSQLTSTEKTLMNFVLEEVGKQDKKFIKDLKDDLVDVINDGGSEKHFFEKIDKRAGGDLV